MTLLRGTPGGVTGDERGMVASASVDVAGEGTVVEAEMFRRIDRGAEDRMVRPLRRQRRQIMIMIVGRALRMGAWSSTQRTKSRPEKI